MRFGEPFSPHLKSIGPLIPLGILRSRSLKDGPKLLLARLYMYAGKKDNCNPSLKKLAEELGTSEDKIGRSLNVLTKGKYIRRERRGPNWAECIVLWHPDLVSSLREPNDSAELRNQDPSYTPQNCGDDSADLRSLDSAELRSAIKEEENHQLESGRESSSGSVEEVSASESSDDDLPFKAGTEAKIRQFFEARRFPIPRGETPFGTIARLLKASRGEVGDLDGFFSRYAAKLQDPPATWKHILVAFEHWIQDPKVKSNLEERRSGRERERSRKLKLDTAMAFEQALEFLDRVENFDIPFPHVERLRRRVTGLISPSDLRKQARSMQRPECAKCGERGIVGSAVQKTLEFCGCPSGDEDRRVRGESFIADQIAAANVNIQSRLAGALDEAGNGFAAEAVRRRKTVIVSESADQVLVEYDSAENRLMQTVRLIKAAYASLGDTRTLVATETERLKAVLENEKRELAEMDARIGCSFAKKTAGFLTPASSEILKQIAEQEAA